MALQALKLAPVTGRECGVEDPMSKEEEWLKRMGWGEVLAAIATKENLISAIMAASLLDELLYGAIKFNLVQLTDAQDRDLFDGNGPLTTFSARIKIAFALGILSLEARADLDSIRHLRNDYAHRFEKADISNQKYKSRVRQLHSVRGMDTALADEELLAKATEALCYYLILRTAPSVLQPSKNLLFMLDGLNFRKETTARLRDIPR